jgi:hypothetical protein
MTSMGVSQRTLWQVALRVLAEWIEFQEEPLIRGCIQVKNEQKYLGNNSFHHFAGARHA